MMPIEKSHRSAKRNAKFDRSFQSCRKTTQSLKESGSENPLAPEAVAGKLYAIEQALTALTIKAEGSPARDEIENAISICTATCVPPIAELRPPTAQRLYTAKVCV